MRTDRTPNAKPYHLPRNKSKNKPPNSNNKNSPKLTKYYEPLHARLGIGAILLLSILTFSYHLTRPLAYNHDWNGAHYGIYARNHIKYGLLTTTGAQVNNLDQDSQAQFNYDFHHPNGYPLLLAASFRILGINELGLRLPSVLATTATVLILFLIAHRWYGLPASLAAALFPLATPMLRYYGSLPAQEPTVLALITAQLYIYILWLKTPTNKLLITLLICTALACSMGWPGYYLTPLLCIHYLWTKHAFPISLRALLALPFLMFGLHLFHAYLTTGSPLGGGLGSVLFFRLSSEANQISSFTYIQFIAHSLRWLMVYYTKTYLLIAGVSALFLANSVLQKPRNSTPILILLLLIYGAAHPLLFRNAAYVHEYMWIYFIPFLSLATSHCVSLINQTLNLPRLLTIIILSTTLLIWHERQAFVHTLFTAPQSASAAQIGKFLAPQTQPGDRLLLPNSEYLSFFGRFIQFYTDRHINSDPPPLDQLATYRFIIIPTTHTLPDPQFIAYLDTHFTRHTFPDFIYYDTTQTLIPIFNE